eukprot:Skav208324  [mRNA]  locus=scaffold897:768640:771483:+ [translate_table: standard]
MVEKPSWVAAWLTSGPSCTGRTGQSFATQPAMLHQLLALVTLTGVGALSSIKLGRIDMTLKVGENKVLYKPKEGMMSATYPVFEFDKAEWDSMVDKPADGMVIEYEELSHKTSTSEGGDGAVPEGGFSHPYTKCKIKNVVKPLLKSKKG